MNIINTHIKQIHRSYVYTVTCVLHVYMDLPLAKKKNKK